MSALKTYLKATNQAARLSTDATEAASAAQEALRQLAVEVDTVRLRAARLSILLGRCRLMLDSVYTTEYAVVDDAHTRFCEPTLNHYGFALVDHPTKRNYLTIAFKEQA